MKAFKDRFRAVASSALADSESLKTFYSKAHNY